MLGASHGLSEKAQVIKYCTYFKAQSEDQNHNPTFFLLKDCDEKKIEDKNRGQESLGETKNTKKIKEHAATSSIAPDPKRSIA